MVVVGVLVKTADLTDDVGKVDLTLRNHFPRIIILQTFLHHRLGKVAEVRMMRDSTDIKMKDLKYIYTSIVI
jgi:hypothetical protein